MASTLRRIVNGPRATATTIALILLEVFTPPRCFSESPHLQVRIAGRIDFDEGVDQKNTRREIARIASISKCVCFRQGRAISCPQDRQSQANQVLLLRASRFAAALALLAWDFRPRHLGLNLESAGKPCRGL